MKKIVALFTALCLFSAQAVAFPHGGTSSATSYIPSASYTYDFTTESLPTGVTLTRASAKGCFDNTGTLQQLSSNQPCFDYSGPTPNFCGLRIDEQRTNNALYSRDLTNAVWTKSGSMTVAKDATGIDGQANSASTITAGAANQTVTQSITASGSQRYSVFMKRKTGTGAVQLTSNNGTLWTTTAITSSWARYFITASTNPVIGIRLVTSGDAVYVDVVQDEIGADVTSPIITTSAPVTRAADVVADTTNVSGYFNATAGTLAVEAMRTSASSNAVDYVASFDDGTASNNISVTSSTNLPGATIVKAGSTFNSAGMMPNYAANAVVKSAVSYGTGQGAGFSDSAQDLVSTQFNSVGASDISNATVPTGITAIRFGNRFDGTRNFNGCLRKVKYYSGALTTAQKVATTFPDGSGTSVGTVTANLASTSVTIPADFIGWSAETTDAILDTIYVGTNSSLIGLVNLLGTSGQFRVGGNAQDTIPSPALTQSIATHLGDFTAALGSGWTIIYGLSSPENDSAKAVTQAGYMLTGVPNNRVLFSVGNEQSQHTTRASWTAAFDSYYAAIKAAYPSAKFEGPEDSDANLQTWINGTTAGLSNLELATFHYYAQGASPKPTLTQVLAQAGAYNWAQVYGSISNVAYAGSKLRIGEGNINYNGGSQGITDRAIAATDWLQKSATIAKLGYNGYSQHNLVSVGQPFNHVGYYNFFYKSGSDYLPAPIFNGMYFFSKVVGQQIVTSSLSGGLSSKVSAIATKNGIGNANIIIINGDQSNYAQVTPEQSSAWTTANLRVYSPTSCTDLNPTINGGTIAAGGASVPTATSLSRGTPVVIPPCGAALVQIQP
ncbi:phage head spike fiber domain-containing protein [Tundrisphaera lichenicola]|uniref:phage head spike fiber domain-containing protein n=1 Tax=Tundrisphaera lichenicola TaxID=2029860 RepID=UPI003EBED3CE